MEHEHGTSEHDHGKSENHKILPDSMAEHTDSTMAQTPVESGAVRMRKIMAKPLVMGLFTGILAIILVFVVSVSVAIYKYGWESSIARSLVHTLPLPAASVNGHVVSYGDYMDDLQTVRHFFVKQKENGEAAESPPEAELRKGVLDRLIQNELLEIEAKKYNVVVTLDDTKVEFEKLAAGKPDAASQIHDLYGWTPEEFQLNVIRPYLLEQKLGEAFSKDPANGGAAETEAKDVLAKARAGEDFGALAKAHSKDPGSAQNGGELGWFAKGVMVPEFEAAAFALKPGEISEPIKTQFGWHVIKVEELKKDKKGVVTEVRAAHVLISVPGITDYLKELFSTAKINRYVAGLAPEKVQVIDSGVAPVEETAPADEAATEPVKK